MQQRIDELDFLKGIFIILMITFHLVYIGDSYPYAKRIVYTFHMPGFLIISGYLMNITKSRKDFIKTMLGYAIPFIVMESGYIVMAAVSLLLCITGSLFVEWTMRTCKRRRIHVSRLQLEGIMRSYGQYRSRFGR